MTEPRPEVRTSEPASDKADGANASAHVGGGLASILGRLWPRRGLANELQHKTAEIEALRREIAEANRLAKLAEGLAGVGYWWFDPKTMSRTWSPNTFALYGLDPADGVPAQGGRGMFDPKDQERLRQAAQGLATEHDPGYVYGFTRADGERRYVRMTGGQEHDADGRLSHMYGAIIDVTEARRREFALAESEARYRLLAESVQDVIVRYNLHGIVEFISPSVRRFGYEPGDIVGHLISEFEAARLGPQLHEDLAQYSAGRPFPDGVRSETLMKTADGSAVWIESVETGIYDEAGAFFGVIGVLRDVTERHALEAHLRSKQAEAEAAVVAKSEFLANMSHEIRTPLTAVIGYTGLMAKIADLPDKARTYADRVNRSGEALNSIVNNILDFSKVEAGQVHLKPETFVVRNFIDDAIAQVQESATQKGLTIAVETEGYLPEEVLADRARLGQILLNLLTNAIKFTHQGGVIVRQSYDEQSQRLGVSVIDTGIGIQPEQSARLFQRFSQVEGSNTRRFGGVGLGLAISKGLIELMNGEIGVESAEGTGSTFWFRVPAPSTEVSAAGAPDQAEEPAFNLESLNILVVDDVHANRELIVALLEPFGPVVIVAAEGAEAVELASKTRFDLVLMDIQMPGMDGLAATRAIRDGAKLSCDTPVLAVSASVLPSDVEACRRAGMNDHVPKPINPRELLSKIALWTHPVDRPKRGFAA